MVAAALGMLRGQAALAPEPATQQDRMAACSEQAVKEELKGDERRQCMSECLSSKKQIRLHRTEPLPAKGSASL